MDFLVFFCIGYLIMIRKWISYVKCTLISFFCQINMPLRAYFFILFLIFSASSASIAMLYFYMDPTTALMMAFSLMSMAIFLAWSSLLSLILFFLKKVYYRGDVNVSTIHSSIRQAILLSVGWILMAWLYGAHIYEPRLIATVWLTLGCIEVMAQAIE